MTVVFICCFGIQGVKLKLARIDYESICSSYYTKVTKNHHKNCIGIKICPVTDRYQK